MHCYSDRNRVASIPILGNHHHNAEGAQYTYALTFQCLSDHAADDVHPFFLGGRTWNAVVRLSMSPPNADGALHVTVDSWVGPTIEDANPNQQAAVGAVIDAGHTVLIPGPYEPVFIKMRSMQNAMPQMLDEEENDDEDEDPSKESKRLVFPPLVLMVERSCVKELQVRFIPPLPVAIMKLDQLSYTVYHNMPEATGILDARPVPPFIPAPPPPRDAAKRKREEADRARTERIAQKRSGSTPDFASDRTPSEGDPPPKTPPSPLVGLNGLHAPQSSSKHDAL